MEDRAMKKLFRVTTYPVSFKGLLNGQSRFFSKYFEFTAISSPGPELVELSISEGVRTVSLSMSRQITPLLDLISLFKMSVLFAKEQPDIIHSHTPKAGLIAMLAGWMTRCPRRIHTVAGLPLMVCSGAKKYLLILVERLTYACATMVIPNSKGLYDYIIEHRLCCAKKIRFIEPGSSNGIDLDYFSIDKVLPESNECKRTLNITDDAFIFMFAGRLVKDKGIEELVDAFSKVAPTAPHCRLVILGDFDYGLNPISELTRHILHTHPQITMVGFQPDVRPYLAVSDMLILPSYREGLPQIVLQACAMGTPCMVSDIIGCVDIITDQHNGLVIESQSSDAIARAMQNILQNASLLDTLSQNARPSVERYRQDGIWNALLEIYQG